MLTVPCVCTLASMLLSVLPRLIGTATEFGVDRRAVAVIWQVWGGALGLRHANLGLGCGRIGRDDRSRCRAQLA